MCSVSVVVLYSCIPTAHSPYHKLIGTLACTHYTGDRIVCMAARNKRKSMIKASCKTMTPAREAPRSIFDGLHTPMGDQVVESARRQQLISHPQRNAKKRWNDLEFMLAYRSTQIAFQVPLNVVYYHHEIFSRSFSSDEVRSAGNALDTYRGHQYLMALHRHVETHPMHHLPSSYIPPAESNRQHDIFH